MSVPLYFDHNVSAAVADGLRRRGVDVLTAYEDGYVQQPDERVLQRATDLGRVLYSQDRDYLAIARRWVREQRPFVGVLYSHQQRLSTGQVIAELELVAMVGDLEDFVDRVRHLPL